MAGLAAWSLLVVAISGHGLGLVSVLLALASAAPLLGGFWLSAFGLGRALRGRGVGGTLALGGAAVLLLGWLGGWAIGLNRAVAVAVMAPGWGLAAWTLWRHRPDPPPIGFSPLLLVPGLALLAVAASVPPGGLWRVEAFGYDTLSYHLQIPREWLAAGGMVELRHSVYGYLPGLMENGYGLAMAALGTDPAAGPLAVDRAAAAAVPCQLLHASFAVVAALCVREAVGRRGAAGWAAGGVFLVVPWVVITGSSAYNEMASLCFGAAALARVAADRRPEWPAGPTVRGAPAGVPIGLLLGAACLAKPTAGFLLALPLGGWMLGRAFLDPRTVGGLIGKRRRSAALRAAAVAAATGFAVLTPWFLRNALWTGNPVFPFATGLFGAGHWSPGLVTRWAAAHARPADASTLDLWRQWLGNAGFGALGGRSIASTSTDIARFAREGGVPFFWMLAALGVAVGLRSRRTRGLATGAAWLLLFQLGSWWLVTHHQSRFLVFTALPGAIGVGLLVAAAGRRARWVAVPAVGVVACVAAVTLVGQTRTLPGEAPGASVRLAPWELMQALSAPGFDGLDAHPADTLPPGSRVLVVGDNGGLLYADAGFIYATAFDENPLASWVEEAAGDPDRLARRLRGAGFTHALVGWSELVRLSATYGVDPRLEPEGLAPQLSGWERVDGPAGSLLRVPPAG